MTLSPQEISLNPIVIYWRGTYEGTNPDASASRAKSRHRFVKMIRDSLLMDGNIDFLAASGF